ncbi:hypothetical protein T484DRAFT_1831165 [Baffinella frigidus]|nr:hypothetical protein T484DRAFT_1831165 [Cryptophyta sp. CCMP2293]
MAVREQEVKLSAQVTAKERQLAALNQDLARARAAILEQQENPPVKAESAGRVRELETAADKARLDQARLDKERWADKRLADEGRLEDKRLADEERLADKRLADGDRLEDKARLDEERLARQELEEEVQFLRTEAVRRSEVMARLEGELAERTVEGIRDRLAAEV